MIIMGSFSPVLHTNICCGYSLEAPRRGASNEYPQHMFLLRNKKNYPIIIPLLQCTIIFSLINLMCVFMRTAKNQIILCEHASAGPGHYTSFVHHIILAYPKCLGADPEMVRFVRVQPNHSLTQNFIFTGNFL